MAQYSLKPIKNDDIIISRAPADKYGNKVPVFLQKSPFDLKEDECVISYQNDNKIRYFKI
jgi:hypothetical protein